MKSVTRAELLSTMAEVHRKVAWHSRFAQSSFTDEAMRDKKLRGIAVGFVYMAVENQIEMLQGLLADLEDIELLPPEKKEVKKGDSVSPPKLSIVHQSRN